MALDIVETKNGEDVTVLLKGELTVATAPALETTLAKILDSCSLLTIDMGECKYISSAGIRVLMSAFKRLKPRGVSMKLIHVSEAVLEVFQYTGLDSIFDIQTAE